MWFQEDTASRFKITALCVFILLFGIFLGKNYTPVSVWIFGWTPAVPLIFFALFCFGAGFVSGWAVTVLLHRRLES
ncbi:MAG TPA: LapA family protein [bacterium]|nr:LapA family protein [Candidatus Omnitrophota bacterium]HOJ62056.1 LapA family protein [bacterium]HPO99791.1 LapA family protein [bacterium]HXK93341.1 LapA family protein [bacterium]